MDLIVTFFNDLLSKIYIKCVTLISIELSGKAFDDLN